MTVAGIAIVGPDAGNYSLASTTAATIANIMPRSLTVTPTGVNKVYDGTSAATVSFADNRIAGDSFTDASASATFTDKNAGTGKIVTVSGIAITGGNAGNYSLANTTAATTANISPRSLTVSATGVNNVYEGPPPPPSLSPTTASRATASPMPTPPPPSPTRTSAMASR